MDVAHNCSWKGNLSKKWFSLVLNELPQLKGFRKCHVSFYVYLKIFKIGLSYILVQFVSLVPNA